MPQSGMLAAPKKYTETPTQIPTATPQLMREAVAAMPQT